MKNKKKIFQAIDILRKSIFLVFLLSVYQLLSYKFNFEFDKIFRMNPSSNLQPYGAFLRISGPNIEPSMLSIYLIFSFAIFFFKKKIDYKILLIIILNGILSTSSTFFIGIFLIIFIGFFIKRNRQKIKILKIIMLCMFSMFILIKIYPQILSLFLQIFEKINGNGTSGLERSKNMIHHLKLSLNYPLVGIGYGISRSKDLLSTWILNTGYLGILSFLSAIYISRKKINKYTKGIYLALIFFYFLEFISVPEPYFLYSWIFWGILDSSKNIKNKKKEKK